MSPPRLSRHLRYFLLTCCLSLGLELSSNNYLQGWPEEQHFSTVMKKSCSNYFLILTFHKTILELSHRDLRIQTTSSVCPGTP